MVDIQGLLQPISGDNPSGPNLEYDAAFAELERLAQGKAEHQEGSTIVAAEEPDWRLLVNRATELLNKTKDLRVAMHLTRGLLRSGGFEGFADGLAVLNGLVGGYWLTVHPQLDPDDDHDPTMRVNILAELCDGPTVIQWARSAPLVSARGFGQYTLRDVEIASGECPPPANSEGSVPDLAAIEAAFLGADAVRVQAIWAAVQQARTHVVELENLLTAQVGVGNTANLSSLRRVLDRAFKALLPHVAGNTTLSTEVGAASAVEAAADPLNTQAQNRQDGDIASRDDVVRAIDKICAYYQRTEPSSPIPLLLKRVRRLINKDFLAIIRDLAPDGLSQVEMLRGPTEEEDGSS